MQAAQEITMALRGTPMANSTLTMHAAGWPKGGLTFGCENFINDMEALQPVAELCIGPEADAAALAFDALAEVEPGGHLLADAHTMARSHTAFYQPVPADLSNFGTWTEAGAEDSATRATRRRQDVPARFTPPPGGAEAAERLAPVMAARIRAGGAAPVGSHLPHCHPCRRPRAAPWSPPCAPDLPFLSQPMC